MSNCIDRRFEEMLYAYELGMLSDEDERQLELHLYECTHCFESVRQFKDSSWLLRHSAKVREQVESYVEPARTINVTRILLIAAVLLVVAIPVYRIGFAPDETDSVIQQLLLLPDRGAVVFGQTLQRSYGVRIGCPAPPDICLGIALFSP